MRGTLEVFESLRFISRIIPAHAGNSHHRDSHGTRRPDHPRACGELSEVDMPAGVPIGSSPRMRGTLHRRRHFQDVRRIIPAHAGNSFPSRSPPRTRTDHPRACGELGGHRRHRVARAGSSPRMRGTLVANVVTWEPDRIIPAHAGNSLVSIVSSHASPDHPRACGELDLSEIAGEQQVGSSPRMRGTPLSRRR